MPDSGLAESILSSDSKKNTIIGSTKESIIVIISVEVREIPVFFYLHVSRLILRRQVAVHSEVGCVQ